MTGKRFRINVGYSKSLPKLIGVIRDNDEDMYMTDVVDLLNNLSDENEKLKRMMKKSVIERLLDGFEKSYKDLEEENDYLKRLVKSYQKSYDELKDKYNEQSVEYEGLEEQVERLLDFKDKVFDLINEKIKYYMKQPCLAMRLPVDCEYRHSCLHNNSINVCNKAKENAYRELEKELQNE